MNTCWPGVPRGQPVTATRRASRTVYLVTAGDCVAISDGPHQPGGQAMDAARLRFDAAVRSRRVHHPVRAELQYTGEKPADPITLYVYAGATAASRSTKMTA